MSVEAALERWFDAFNAHDLDALCRTADPRIEIIPFRGATTIPDGVIYRGHDGLRSLCAPGFERYPLLRLDHGPVQEVVGGALLDIRFVLDDGRSPAQVRAGACVYRVHRDRIRRMHAFDGHSSSLDVRDWRTETSLVAELTPREREVLALLGLGRTVADIADDLVLSPLTIRTHLRNARDKLEARTTAHAVAIAARADAVA